MSQSVVQKAIETLGGIGLTKAMSVEAIKCLTQAGIVLVDIQATDDPEDGARNLVFEALSDSGLPPSAIEEVMISLHQDGVGFFVSPKITQET